MTPDRFRRVDELFHAARVLDPAARAAYLSAQCGDDHTLHAEVTALLDHDGTPQSYLETRQLDGELRLADSGRVARAVAPESPSRIGPYRVLRLVGEGGMGVVYQAEQESPRRTVALKVLRAARITPEVLRRFENEANVLGRLQHPGIAQIFEAGTADIAGVRQMYLAMEFIAGQPLIRFADQRSLSIPDRLQLLARVCDAVQHAHQKGVIHRDLKPGNILVVEEGTGGSRSRGFDGDRSDSATIDRRTLDPWGPQPKVLDFGVARVTDSDIAITTVQTDVGQLIGTLPYMSPEQVLGNPNDVDTRSDVYALGVLLHELLTGRLPYDLRNRTVPEAARIICDQLASRLSTISRVFRGDIDTIVAKALEKDKARRYQSAAELAADIRAHLAGAPIAAKRDSAWYVLQKTLRRYKVAVAAALAFLLVVTVAAVALGFLYNRAEREAAAARTDRDRAAAAEQVARAESDRAQLEARKATLVSAFLKELLQSANPKAMRGAVPTVRDALDAATERISGELGTEPEVEAAIRLVIAETYASLALYPQADEHFRVAEKLFRTATPEGSPGLAECISQRGILAGTLGDWNATLVALRESEAIMRKLPGDNAEDLAWVLMNQGSVLRVTGELDRAEPLLREAVRMYREIPLNPRDRGRECHRGDALAALGALLHAKKAFDEAETFTKEALALYRVQLGESHPEIAPILNNLAAIKRGRGDLAGALPLYQDALAMARKLQGDDHPDVAMALHNLANLLADTDELAAAEPLFREGLTIRRNRLPARHPQIAESLIGLSLILMRLDRAAEAEPFAREAVEIRQEHFAGKWQVQTATSIVGACLSLQGKFDEAEPLLVSAYEQLLTMRGPTHMVTLEALKRIIAHYEACQKPDQAARYRAILEAPPAATSPTPRGS